MAAVNFWNLAAKSNPGASGVAAPPRGNLNLVKDVHRGWFGREEIVGYPVVHRLSR